MKVVFDPATPFRNAARRGTATRPDIVGWRTRACQWWVSLALLAGGVVSLSAQDDGAFARLLSGDIHPLTVTLKDLTNHWRRITVQSSGLANGNVSVNVNGQSGSAVSQNNLIGSLSTSRGYVTRGETAHAGGRTYLVAYHLPGAGLDLAAVVQALVTKTPIAGAVLTPESQLRLSLLDVSALSSLEDVQTFDLAAELAESEKAVQALANLFKSESGNKPSPRASENAPKPSP